MLRYLLPSVVLTTSLLAQGAPTFVPKPGLMRCAAEDVPKLLEQLPASAVGKLLADADVAAAFATALGRYREMADRREALLSFVSSHEIELESWMRANLMYTDGHAAVRQIDLADLQRIELRAILGEEQPMPRSVVTLCCRPRAEGRWTALFDRHAKSMADNKQWKQDADAKFGGFPVWQFAPAAGSNDETQMAPFGAPASAWLLHLGGLFAFGSDSPDACGVLAPPPARPPAQVVAEMDLAAYLAMFRRMMGALPSEFAALGFDALTRIQWRGTFDGARILDEIEVEFVDEPKGLVGALLAGKAALPAQPLPAGALTQLRCGVDLPMLLECARTAGLGEVVSEQLAKLVPTALTGGVAIGVCAPAPGGMIPRLYLSLGIADEKAAGELLAALTQGSAKTKEVTYEDVPCTVLELPGAPPALQPTWCRVGAVLHVAESPLSMRAFLKARAQGGNAGGGTGAEAMDVGDAPLPQGAGEVLPTFDVRCDEQQLYLTFHKVWLPLLMLVADRGEAKPLVGAQEMPSPDVVLPHLGKSRGVLRRDGKVFRLQQLGALGGVEAAAVAMTWGPFLSGLFHGDWTLEQVESAVARHQLQAVWAALETFQTNNKRWPNDLAELFADKKLPVDALLMPGDGKAEVVVLPAGDTRTVKTSFRYFKDGVEVNAGGNQQKMLLIAIAPRRYARPMLSVDGAIPEIWGEDSTRPIQTFGK